MSAVATQRGSKMPHTAAHTVVIKGVKLFQNNASQEYSDLDIMQMMGRAVSQWSLHYKLSDTSCW